MSTEKSTRDTARAAASAAEIESAEDRRAFMVGFLHAVEGGGKPSRLGGEVYREGFAAGRMDLRAQAYIAESAQFISRLAA